MITRRFTVETLSDINIPIYLKLKFITHKKLKQKIVSSVTY